METKYGHQLCRTYWRCTAIATITTRCTNQKSYYDQKYQVYYVGTVPTGYDPCTYWGHNRELQYRGAQLWTTTTEEADAEEARLKAIRDNRVGLLVGWNRSL